MSKDRVAVVGVGNVGATTAYALLLSGLAPDIVLINRDRKKAEGEAEDISHAEPWSHTTLVRAGGFEDCATAKVIVVAVGAGLGPGETRLDLLKKNAAIFRDLIPKIVATNPKGILLIATNPVDALTHYARKLSGFDLNRVVGSGTILDTARLRVLLGDHYGVDPQSVHAYVIGEHGDSQVPVWSAARIAGLPLQEFCRVRGVAYDKAALDEMALRTRNAYYRIGTGAGGALDFARPEHRAHSGQSNAGSARSRRRDHELPDDCERPGNRRRGAAQPGPRGAEGIDEIGRSHPEADRRGGRVGVGRG
jgi:L-lactate dehydrogenase